MKCDSHLQGCRATQGDKRGNCCICWRQVWQLPRAAAKAAAGRLAPLEEAHDVLRRDLCPKQLQIGTLGS